MSALAVCAHSVVATLEGVPSSKVCSRQCSDTFQAATKLLIGEPVAAGAEAPFRLLNWSRHHTTCVEVLGWWLSPPQASL